MRMERVSFPLTAVILAMIAVSTLAVLPGSEAVLSASASVQFSTQEQRVDPPEEGSANAVYQGVITAQAILAKGQTLILYPVLMTDGLEHAFDPPEITMDEETIGTEVPFEMTIFVDRKVQAGEMLLEVKVRWKNQPGTLGGISEASYVKLYVGEIEDGEVYAPGSLDVIEGEKSVLEVEVLNTGNTWNEYDLEIEGIDRAESNGILIGSDGGYSMDLYYQSKDTIAIDVYPDDIDGVTSVILTLILKDKDTGFELDRRSMRIDATEPVGPIPPEKPEDNDNRDSQKDDEIPDTDDKEDPKEDVTDPVQEDGSVDGTGAWIVFPIGFALMVLGIGSYLFFALRKRGANG
ncbi:MAG: hypothetical protein ACMUHB_00525 [Thermoplasmatota archaeon]